jgi:archaellum component FlaC
MDTVDKLQDISSRLEHLENVAEWITREMVHLDSGISQSGSLICTLAEQIREQIFALVEDLEKTKDEEEEDEFFGNFH